MSDLKCTTMTWDWKSCPHLDDLEEALKPFGLIVTEHPAFEGSDQFGFIISDRPLTDEELQEASEAL